MKLIPGRNLVAGSPIFIGAGLALLALGRIPAILKPFRKIKKDELRVSKSGEWVKLKNRVAVVGSTL
jgi:hypothetical protein